MSRRDDLDPTLDARLGELLRDAVADVEPDERLGELRARVSRPARRRPTVLVLAGSALAGAAVVAAVAVAGPALLGSDGGPKPSEPPVASSPGEPSSDDTAATEPSTAPVATRAVAGYYLGDTPAGVRLFREFRSVEAADDGPDASVRLLTTDPADPDYRTLWPEGAFGPAEVDADRITVELADPGLAERPATMTEEEAAASVQQVVYTLQAYAQQRLPVEFTAGAGVLDQVLGVPVDGPLSAASPLEVLSLVNLTTPEEGQEVAGQLRVEGVANAFEGTVLWSLEDASGQAVDEGFFTAEGSMGDRLFPFSGPVDLSSVAPGTYTLVVSTGDASGGAEGPGPMTDDRQVTLR